MYHEIQQGSFVYLFVIEWNICKGYAKHYGLFFHGGKNMIKCEYLLFSTEGKWKILDVSGCTLTCDPWQTQNSQYYVILVFLISLKGLLAIDLFIELLTWYIVLMDDNYLLELIDWSDCGYVNFLNFMNSQIWTIEVQCCLFIMFESLIIWYSWNLLFRIYLWWGLCISIVRFTWKSMYCNE